MKQLSVAIIGAGNIAGGFDEKKQAGDGGIYTHAGAFAAHGGFDLKTVFDIDRDRARAFGKFWNVQACTDSLRQIYDARHDVVSVCTPDETHFEIARTLLESRCCKTIFIEKPLAYELGQIEELASLSERAGIHLVVNFQRHHETVHGEMRDLIAAHPEDLLSVNGQYMKGLRHIGVTMIDTLNYLCGLPEAVLAFRRVWNQESSDYSYEFILFYPGFSVAIKTTDSERFHYNYHIFELDFLFANRRIALVDISQAIREAPVTEYAYSGVKVMNERAAQIRGTEYKRSMLDVVKYVHDITIGKAPHDINTASASYNNQLIINTIIESFERGSVKLTFDPASWKR
ncbi:Gfo/Idh/MocA family oxidoreductase [Herbaspirillum sp. HC18]|nr:Gfo/Idh/MocA family oxidoreductase [Herbaspirillum sp. HC18]